MLVGEGREKFRCRSWSKSSTAFVWEAKGTLVMKKQYTARTSKIAARVGIEAPAYLLYHTLDGVGFQIQGGLNTCLVAILLGGTKILYQCQSVKHVLLCVYMISWRMEPCTYSHGVILLRILLRSRGLQVFHSIKIRSTNI
jgi:hypothetical protein